MRAILTAGPILFVAAIPFSAASEPSADLNWLAGYWLSCAGEREVSETWTDQRGGVMLGSSLNYRADGRVTWEHMRIGPSTGGKGLSFFANPAGQAPTEFSLVSSGPAKAVFHNPEHDFPQTVIYRRDGDGLIGRIEGKVGGRARSAEWQYETHPLNARCSVPDDTHHQDESTSG